MAYTIKCDAKESCVSIFSLLDTIRCESKWLCPNILLTYTIKCNGYRNLRIWTLTFVHNYIGISCQYYFFSFVGTDSHRSRLDNLLNIILLWSTSVEWTRLNQMHLRECETNKPINKQKTNKQSNKQISFT